MNYSFKVRSVNSSDAIETACLKQLIEQYEVIYRYIYICKIVKFFIQYNKHPHFSDF